MYALIAMKKKINAITLDLDDTLWPVQPTIDYAEQCLMQWMHKKAPQAAQITTLEKIKAVRDQVETDYPQWKHNLSAYRREAIRRLLNEAGEDESLADYAFAYYFAARQKVHLFEDSLPALERLSKKFPLAAITNGNANLKIIGLDHYFQGTIAAQDIGSIKPDRCLFDAAAQLLGQTPESILHIGDDIISDVSGALQAGMQAAWLNRLEPSSKQIEKLTIEPDYIVSNLCELCELLKV